MRLSKKVSMVEVHSTHIQPKVVDMTLDVYRAACSWNVDHLRQKMSGLEAEWGCGCGVAIALELAKW